MTPEELTACRERHAHADAPSAALDGQKNISLVYSGLGRQAHEDRGKLLDEVLALQIALDCCVDKGGFDMACDQLRRVTDVLATWAQDHPREQTADVDAALYCAREFLSKVNS